MCTLSRNSRHPYYFRNFCMWNVLLLLCLSTAPIVAQSDAAPRRWQLGLHTGLQLSEERFADLGLQSGYYQATLHYRLRR